MYCTNCIELRITESKQKSYKKRRGQKEPSGSLEEISKEIREYNEKHGTRLTYGKYTALKRLGKI